MADKLAVSVSEAARLLDVGKSKMYELISQEGFPSFKLGGHTLVSVEGLRAWVERQTEAGHERE